MPDMRRVLNKDGDVPKLSRISVVLAVALLAGLTAQHGAAAVTLEPPPIATVEVGDCPAAAAAVPADYLGLSIEWGMVSRWFGTDRTAVVQPMVRLLRSVSRTPGVLRIGGNSEDGFTWSPDGDISGNGAFNGTISRGMVDALFEVARETGWTVVLGLNLRADDPANAVALAAYARSVDTSHRLIALEIGNEPNAYFGNDVAGYIARVQKYVAALDADPATAGSAIAGPALSNQADVSYVAAFAQAFGSRMPFATWHAYANRPTLTDLLDEGAAADWRNRIALVASAAGAVPTRMAEGNSVGNGGLDRVSSVMGSTAWLLDTLLTGAALGLSGYNLHSWDGSPFPAPTMTAYYTPFVIRNGAVLPSPGVYALALTRSLPGSRFCTSTTVNATNQSVKSWAVTDADGRHVYLYLVNKGVPGHEGTVSVTAPTTRYGSVTVSRIEDPGGCAGRSTSIEGAQVPASGQFAWTPEGVLPHPGSATYSVYLAACQSALVDFRPQSAHPPVRPWRPGGLLR
jgi:hypothetical protein